MALYHLSVKTISRRTGRTATGAAAYRAGVEITDAPAWAQDRAAL